MPKCPHCPLCRQPPYMVMGGGTQAFCGNDDCEMFIWNPAVSAAQNLSNAKPIDITPSDSTSTPTEEGR